MMNFMREGGVAMWLTLAFAIGAGAVAFARPRGSRGRTLAIGAGLTLCSGLAGLASGLIATTEHFGRHPRPVEILAEGIRESSNNGIFAAALGVFLLIGAALQRDAQSAAP